MSDSKKNGLDNPAFEAPQGDLEKNNIQEHATNTGGDRVSWANSIEFLMSCIAMSVGLGNIWRFPFAAYENGGGAFLIPYLIVLLVVGRPLYYMEMSLGQFSNKGNVKFFKSLAPYLKGVGFAQVFGSFCVGTYYTSLIAISLFYFINSFTGQLPWGTCSDEWKSYELQNNIVCVNATAKERESDVSSRVVSSSELYFQREVLREITDISDGIGNPEWRLTLCLLAPWVIVFLISIRGVRSSGKAAYFLALFPYVIMITLLIRAATLEGAGDGMYYFIKTDWSKLGDADVWYAAVTQCFYSLNVGFGTIIMYSSYNNFEHNINRDALIISILDSFTSLLSGVTIFGILGNLAYNMNVTPDEVINSGGTGLAFISYPNAISKMESVPWLFAIIFFFMLFILGIGSLVAIQAAANTVILDSFPSLRMWQVSALTGSTGFLLGLMYVTPGGQFMLNLVDYFGGTFMIFIFIIIEVTGVAWFYGLEDFCLDLEFMTKRKVNIYWRLTWGLITPCFLIFVFVYFCVKFAGPSYGDYSFPTGILVFGWAIVVVGLLQFVFWIIRSVYKNRQLGFPQMVTKAFSNENWGPKGEGRYEDWKKFKAASREKNTHANPFTKFLLSLIGK